MDKHTQAWAMIAQAVVNIDEGHTTIEPGSAVHDGMKDLIADPVYAAAPELLEALEANLNDMLYAITFAREGSGPYKRLSLAIDNTRAIIAKATGK